MTRVAFLTAGCVRPDAPDRREDYWEHGLEFAPLRAGCAARGVRLEEVVWDAQELDPAAYDALVIGTTWDYAERPEAFLATLERCAAVRPLFNPLDLVRWNLDKGYLRDLEERGVRGVPTLWRERADAVTIAAAFDELGCDEVVVKPRVGASAWRQVRLARDEPLPDAAALPPGRALIQPFLRSALDEGELSFLFFGGVFSHCARKRPRAGDYRVQSMYGGREGVHAPDDEELGAASSVLEHLPGPPLYARVDMMRTASGRLALMELELVEPYLYPEQGPRMGEAFALALEDALEHA